MKKCQIKILKLKKNNNPNKNISQTGITSKIKMIEEWLSELEDKSLKIILLEQKENSLKKF